MINFAEICDKSLRLRIFGPMEYYIYLDYQFPQYFYILRYSASNWVLEFILSILFWNFRAFWSAVFLPNHARGAGVMALVCFVVCVYRRDFMKLWGNKFSTCYRCVCFEMWWSCCICARLPMSHLYEHILLFSSRLNC